MNRPGISRRDFVRGKFFPATDDYNVPDEDADAVETKPLRYPKSSEELNHSVSASATKPSEQAARRRTIPIHRPPGAVAEPDFLAGCTRCNDCIDACPYDAIVQAPPRMREAAGTPMIDVDHQPCLMCTDFPCIAACEPNVLTHLVPITMGTAKVTAQTCLAYQNTMCTVCSERCPVPEAITVAEGKPTIDEETCTGCGVCRYVCPAPENAILLMPTFVRASST